MAVEATKKFQRESDGPPSPGGAPRGGYQKPKDTKKTVKRLLKYLTEKKALLLLVLVCVIISSVGSIGGSYMLRPITNKLVEDLPIAEKAVSLINMLLVLGILYVAGTIATFIQSRVMVQLAQKGTNRLRRDLFNKLQDMPLTYFDRHSHGELMSRLTNDADNVQMALEQSMVTLISSVLMFVGIFAVMLVISPLLFLLTALILVIVFINFKILGGKSRKYFRKQQAAIGELNGNIQEMIEGLKVVKAFTHEEAAKKIFTELNETYRTAATDANYYAGATMPAMANIFNIGFAFTAAFGGLLSIVAGLDVGGFVSYLQFSRQMSQPMGQISQQLTALLSALAGAERIFEMMDSEPELDEGTVTLIPVDETMNELAEGTHAARWAWKVPQPDGSFRLVELKGDVELKQVEFGYVPGKPVLKKVSVAAEAGEKIAFVGSTGAGKTTITNLINRFYEIDGGEITYDGINVREIRKDSLRRSLGMVLQDTHLFTGTVMDNIRYGRLEATDEECIAAAKSSNAHSFIRRLPQGYQTMVSGDGANLSQGQRQLLAIARAAVADPPVMILDEATSSIDTRTEKHIEKGMDALMENRTVFVIAHRLSTVRNSDCIVVIEHGEIEEKGSHSELLALKGRYHQLYTGQFQLE
ncbi:MAG: Multidrug resistance transporter ATP-binding and permease protein [Oscillospiraceae bacterium]|nr:Multidrug resistance transporter ATP-binding and permease protein [Oscillospiraceae bacterium]